MRHVTGWRITLICLSILPTSGSQAATCLAPPRPFVPADPTAVQAYADLIGADFENYLSEIGRYIQCLDEERTRAFGEAQEVAEEYGRFIDAVRK